MSGTKVAIGACFAFIVILSGWYSSYKATTAINAKLVSDLKQTQAQLIACNRVRSITNEVEAMDSSTIRAEFSRMFKGAGSVPRVNAPDTPNPGFEPVYRGNAGFNNRQANKGFISRSEYCSESGLDTAMYDMCMDGEW